MENSLFLMECSKKLKHLEHKTSLTSFDLSGCGRLKEISETLGILTSLTSLDLSECDGLKEILEALGNLTSLTSLDLSGCGGLKEIPEALGSLSSLTSLDLSGCGGLKEIAEALGNLTSLTSLNLSGCGGLKEIPEALGSLTSLTSLNLSGCGGLVKIPEALGNLTSLTSLDLSRCGRLKEIPEALGNLTSLTSLNLGWCWGLKEIPEALGNLTSLTSLDLSGCGGLKEIPEALGNLTSLTSLDLSGCGGLKEIPEALGSLTSLTSLNLSWCGGLKEIPEALGNLTSLTSLDLSWCGGLKEIPEALGNLTSLTSLDLSGCGGLKEIPEALDSLTSLTSIALSDCDGLKEILEALGKLTSLTSLDLSGCGGLKDISEALGSLTSLTSLDLSGCRGLKEIPEALGNLTSLTSLNLSGCGGLKEIPEALGSLTSLSSLDLRYCRNLKEIPEALGNLTSLTSLNLGWCGGLKEIPEALGNLTSLTSLDLIWCGGLKEIPEALGNLTSLTSLDLSWCGGLKEIPEALGNLTSLTSLDLSWCGGLKEIPEALGNLASLTSLNLRACGGLEEIPEALGNLTSLTSLDLSWCKGLKEIPEALGNLTSLTSLNLSGCEGLKEIPEALGNLTSLTSLNLSGCGGLKEIPEALGNLTSLDLSWCEGWKETPNHEETSSSATIERADGDRKIFSHTLGQVEDTFDESQAQAQNNSPSIRRVKYSRWHSIRLARFLHVWRKNLRIPFKKRELFQSGNIYSGKTIPFPKRECPKSSLCIPHDRKEETSALEGPKLQEQLNLQRIICSKGDGVALNMQNLKSNLEDLNSIETTVAGAMVDDSLRLCFENGEIMSRMVGVGLDYAVVMVSCDYEVIVEEKSEDVWRSIARGDETTMTERLVVRTSNHVDCLEGDSSQSLDPIRMAKLIGVGIEGSGKYTYREKKPSIPWNAIIELVKTMFWTRFQNHMMSAINAKSNDAKVQSRVHGARIWDLGGENEDDLKDFKIPPSWWSTKWWQNIAVDDIHLNAPFSFYKESSSGKIGRQQSGGDNVQRGKDPSSSNKDSKVHHQSLHSHGKQKNNHGGDNNDEDDGDDNANRTCQDMDGDDDIISTVCVLVRPLYGCWKPPNEDQDLPLDRRPDPAFIDPCLRFWFHKSTSSREIKVNISVRFDLGGYGPNPDLGTSGRTFFGWFHDAIHISLRSMNDKSSVLKHDNKILQPSTPGMTSYRETSGSTSNPARVSAHLPVSNRPFGLKGLLSWEKRQSDTQTRELVQYCELMNQQCWGGFIFKDDCGGGPTPRLAYNLKHPIKIPNQVWEKPCYDVLVQSGICSTITPAIEGTWEDLDESEASPYLLGAHRVLQKRCRNTILSTRSRAFRETQDHIAVDKQEYNVKLYVNHAMTHMNLFQKLTIAQDKPMKGALINLQDEFYGKVKYEQDKGVSR